MRKLVLLLLFVPIVSFGQTGNLFEKTEKKDAFGDVVGESISTIVTGTFSNNAESKPFSRYSFTKYIVNKTIDTIQAFFKYFIL